MTEALHAPQPSELVEHFLAEAISNSPQPLKDLADFLSNALSEDDWKTADRLLLALGLRTQPPDSWRPDREAVRKAIDWLADEIGAAERGKATTRRVRNLYAKDEAVNRITAALRPQTAESGT